ERGAAREPLGALQALVGELGVPLLLECSPAALDAHIETVRAGEPDPWALHRRWRSEALALRL
ncbi:hypothetical protein C5C27_17640, partial [Rathayibacter sp. AY2B7]